MGAGRYEVVAWDEARDQQAVRRWTAAEIERALPWLKRANAQGRTILIRPAPGEDASLVLVAGLGAAQVAAMRAAGREPAALVEAAPGRLEAWVRIPACEEARRREVGRQLTDEQGVGAELGAPGRYGRLAGFTNPEAGDGKRAPWVLCRSSSGREASAGAELVGAAGERLEARAQVLREERAHEQALERELSRGRGGMSR